MGAVGAWGGDWGVSNLGDRPSSMMIFVGTHLTEFEVKLVFGHLIPLWRFRLISVRYHARSAMERRMGLRGPCRSNGISKNTRKKLANNRLAY